MIALLTAGDSLKRLWSDDMGDDYDTVLAVNCAAFHFKCDKAIALDQWSIKAFKDAGINYHQLTGPFGFAPISFPCALKMACCACDDTSSELHIYGLDMQRIGLNFNDPEFNEARIKREMMWVRLALDGSKCHIKIFGDVADDIRRQIER